MHVAHVYYRRYNKFHEVKFMRIGLTYDLQTDPTDPWQAEFDPPATLEALQQALESLGHEVVLLGNAEDLLRRLRTSDWSASGPLRHLATDVVFNLAEGREGRCREAVVPTLLELLGVPYVGSDPTALAVGLDKLMCKRLAVAEGLLTPRWIGVEEDTALPGRVPLCYPLIVKPRFGGSGFGMDAGAVVESVQALRRRVAWLRGWCRQPLVVEEFIGAGELTVFVIGNHPPQALPPIQRPLDPLTRLSCHLVRSTSETWEAPLTLEEGLEAQACQAAVTMFRAIECRDVARVDLRVDGEGRVHMLEINPLPSFDPAGGLGWLAASLGTSYAALIGRILDATITRHSSLVARHSSYS